MKRAFNKLEFVAYHEAGHTLAAHLLGFKVDYVTIDPEKCAEGAKGDFKWSKGPDKDLFGAFKQIMISAATEAGKCIEGGWEMPLSESDMEDGVRFEEAATEWGGWEEIFPDLVGFFDVPRCVGFAVDNKIEELTAYIINEFRPQLEIIANSLLEKKTLSGQDIHDLMKLNNEDLFNFQEDVRKQIISSIEKEIDELRIFKEEELKA